MRVQSDDGDYRVVSFARDGATGAHREGDRVVERERSTRFESIDDGSASGHRSGSVALRRGSA